MTTYLIDVANFAAIYAILSLSLNLLVGYAGLFSVTQGALFGIGAYGFALVSIKLGVPFPVTLLAAVLAPAIAGAIIALPSIRLSGDYLVIASLGLQTAIVALMMNLTSLTGGVQGLPGIEAPSLFGWNFDDPTSYLPLSLGLALLATAIMFALVHSPYGRALKMISTDELAAAAAGKNVVGLKVSAFVIGSGMAGLAGAAYAGYVRYIDPSSFTILVSIYVMTLVIVGGSGTVFGSIVGAIAVVSVENSLRFLPLPSAHVGDLRQALYGTLLVAFVLWRPQGLLGESRKRRPEDDGTAPQPPETALEEVCPAAAVAPALGAKATAKAALPAAAHGNGAHPEVAPDLECRDVVAGYDSLIVLRGVSMLARSGEIVVLAGHNGSGKSTLLKAIAGTLRVRNGSVLVHGADVTNRQRKLAGAERVGLVPQIGGVFPTLTVRENLRLAGYTLRRQPAQLADRIEEVTELFPALRVRLSQLAGQLSGGQQRMLSIALALVPGYRLLLLDEPSAGLSPQMVESTLETIHDITRRLGLTTVLCEQNVRPALEVGDRAYVLKAGEVALEADAADLAHDRDLWRLF